MLPSDLRQQLLNLGASNSLFRIRPGEDCDLHLEHVIVDAEYYGIASKEDVHKRYTAKIWLDEPTRTVKYREIIREEEKSAGVLPAPKLSFQKEVFKGKVLFKKEKGVAFGFKKPLDPTSFDKVYDYDFDVNKIRGPVKQQVESAGWRFEQIITDYKPDPRSRLTCSRCGASLEPGTVFCSNCGNKITL